MNYDHAYHAANFADIFKHALFCLALDHLNGKEKPYWVLDTHAGAGCYDLSDPRAQKTEEAANGIGKLRAALRGSVPSEVAAALLPYMGALSQSADAMDHGANAYPGSPFLAKMMMRPQDRLDLCEYHPGAFAALKTNLRGGSGGPSVHMDQADGYTVLKARLPPKERRGLVMIDPPFERGDDFTRCWEALRQAHKRWASGSYMVWYPIKDRPSVTAFLDAIKQSIPTPTIVAELDINPGGLPLKLSACGMLLINPPYGLVQSLDPVLEFLASILGESKPGHFRKLIINPL